MSTTDSERSLSRVTVRSTSEEVATKLREAILTGVIEPGEHLPERDLSAALGVSNIALREAFGRLVEEGLVVRVARRGAFAAPISAAFIRDLGDIRIILEQHAVTRAIARWNDERDAEVEAIVDAMDDAAVQSDGETMFRLDQTFHAAFLRASESDLLVELGNNLRGRVARSIRESMTRDPAVVKDIPPLHRRWFELVRARDKRGARAEVALHISRSMEGIAAALEAREQEAPAAGGRRRRSIDPDGGS